MPTIQSHRVQVDDLDLHYLEAGEGPPVLLLHGWPTHAGLWRHALPEIGRSRRAIALDLPGFGRSAKPLDASYSFTFFERVLEGFCDALGLDRPGLAVHDLGGPVGLFWAVRHRERVRELAVLDTLVFPELHWTVKAFVLATRLPGVKQYLASPGGIARAMRFGVNDKARMTDAVVALYQAPFADAAARRALLKAGGALSPRGFDTIAAGIGDFDVPVCLLYGTKDRILPDTERTMGRLKSALPQAQVTALPGIGHFLQEDAPDEVARVLADFFAASAG
mgnify:CR=1 FL=1